MTSMPWHIIRIIRTLFWIVPFYLLALLIKIYTMERLQIDKAIHILTLGIVAGAVCVLAILYQSRNEQTPKKQWRHLSTVSILMVMLYGFCCLLAYTFSGQWVFLVW